jgi:energy-converting hydrogenase A subunit R
LEGPLSPQDNAYDLMSLIPQGDRIFEVISRYDDLLTMQGREDYEPGDTLALIVPFLVLHNIREADIGRLAHQATLTCGARELIHHLSGQSWHIFCITTTYQQYAFHIAQELGIPLSHVAATEFPLDQFHQSLTQEDARSMAYMENEILALADSQNDQAIKRRLDDFFWNRLPQTSIGKLAKKVKPVGGRRKLESLYRFCQVHDVGIGDFAVVADSITDFQMLKGVRDAGGLAIAFNANQYALPYATASLASTHLSDLEPVLSAWHDGSLKDAELLIKQKESAGGSGDRDYFHWLANKGDIGEIIAICRRFRRLVREKAGELG